MANCVMKLHTFIKCKNEPIEGSFKNICKTKFKAKKYCLMFQPLRCVEKIDTCSLKENVLLSNDVSGILNCDTFSVATSIINVNLV